MGKEVSNPKINIIDLTKFAYSNAGARERILQRAKFPDDNYSPGSFYQPTRDMLELFHSQQIGLIAFQDEAEKLQDQSKLIDTATASGKFEAQRLLSNAKAMIRVREHPRLVGGYNLLRRIRGGHSFTESEVPVSANPDFLLEKGDKLLYVKYHLNAEELTSEMSSCILQGMVWALQARDEQLSIQNCAVISLANAKTFTAVADFPRHAENLRAACRQIAAMWPSIRSRLEDVA